MQVAATETQDGPGRILRADPCVIVWDSTDAQQVVRLFHGEGMRAVQAATFSPDGSRLATICTDNTHTLSIWDWRTRQLLLRRGTHAGAPPSVYGIAWSPFNPSRLATFGQNHVDFWTLSSTSSRDSRQACTAVGVFVIADTSARSPGRACRNKASTQHLV